MYVDHSLRVDQKKDKLMDELNFKKCMWFKINTTGEFFVGITVKGRNFIIHVEYFDANKFFLRQFLLNIKRISNVVQDLSTTTKKELKKRD